jgi:hypothetical protein
MKPRDWTLLTLAMAKGRNLQPVQLQKALFLLSRELTPVELGTSDFYNFDAYDYGPFSANIYSDAETLESEGLVEISRPPAVRFRLFKATSQGIAESSRLIDSLPESARDYLGRVVPWVETHSFNEIVRYVYQKFPEMRANSVFRG